MKKLLIVMLAVMPAFCISQKAKPPLLGVQFLGESTFPKSLLRPRASFHFIAAMTPSGQFENGQESGFKNVVSWGQKLSVFGISVSRWGGGVDAFSYVDPSTEHRHVQIYRNPSVFMIGAEPLIILWKANVSLGGGLVVRDAKETSLTYGLSGSISFESFVSPSAGVIWLPSENVKAIQIGVIVKI